MSYKRIDANQGELVAILRRMGAIVAITSDLGNGFPDLVISAHGQNVLCEVKDGSKPLSAQKLTPAEKHFFETWKGPLVILRCVDDAINLIQTIAQNKNE